MNCISIVLLTQRWCLGAKINSMCVHLQGLVQNQSFYPYYGSPQKLVYQADALASNVYSSTFTPYTSLTLPDAYPPAFMPGSPTASNINDTSFTLAVALYEAATVYYVVMPSALVSTTPLSGFCCASLLLAVGIDCAMPVACKAYCEAATLFLRGHAICIGQIKAIICQV